MTRVASIVTGAVGIALTLACGPDSAEPSAPANETIGEVTLQEDPAGREVVARVNGVPIYADCVARQAAAKQIAVRAALDECIDFELLARAADQAGYRDHPAVLDARTTEMARVLMDEAFVAEFDGPEDVPDEHARAAYEQVKTPLYQRPTPWRVVFYVRVEVGKNVEPGSPEDLQARTDADRIYTALRGRRFETEQQFLEAAREAAGDTELYWERQGKLRFSEIGPIEAPFKEATFAIPEPKRVSPPVRTTRGWDIIWLDRIMPPVDVSFEEARPEIQEKIFAQSRAESFKSWLKSLVPDRVQVDQAWLERLARADRNENLLGAGR